MSGLPRHLLQGSAALLALLLWVLAGARVPDAPAALGADRRVIERPVEPPTIQVAVVAPTPLPALPVADRAAPRAASLRPGPGQCLRLGSARGARAPC